MATKSLWRREAEARAREFDARRERLALQRRDRQLAADDVSADPDDNDAWRRKAVARANAFNVLDAKSALARSEKIRAKAIAAAKAAAEQTE